MTERGHVYIDESTAGDYYLLCGLVTPSQVGSLRKALRGLLLPNQRSLHMNSERESRRRSILNRMLELETSVTIYRAERSKYRRQLDARDACLKRTVHDAIDLRISRIVLDRCDPQVQRDKQSILQAEQLTGTSGTFEYLHLKRHEEPLLWIPDAVGWAWARGGQWRKLVRPLVTEIHL